MVRAFAHGAMGRRIEPSWGGPISHFSQCSTTGVTKAVVCVILSVHIKAPLLQRVSSFTIRMVLNHMSDAI